jgi:hypothetical protein
VKERVGVEDGQLARPRDGVVPRDAPLEVVDHLLQGRALQVDLRFDERHRARRVRSNVSDLSVAGRVERLERR